MQVAAKAWCDRGLALACRPERRARPALVLVVTILASSLDFLDGSVVNVGLPAIRASLGGSAAGAQWVIDGYLLPLSALLLLGGALGDRFGRRRMLVIGVAVFILGSLTCAAATRLEALIMARILQGLAAALMIPTSLAILGSAFEEPERGRAVGIWTGAGAIATAIGPVLGGWLIDTVGWRAIFLINAPLGLAAILLAFPAIPADTENRSAAGLDWRGALLITGALASLVWGLIMGAGPHGWTAIELLAVALGVGLAAAYLLNEKSAGERALTPPSLFGSRAFVGLNLATLLIYGALSAYMLLVPYVLITSLSYSATSAGAALLPFPLVVGALSFWTGALAGRWGARGFLISGSIFISAGVLLVIRMGRHAGYWTAVFPSVLMMALGVACIAGPLTEEVLRSVDTGRQGAASGLNSSAAQLGGLLFIALLGVVLASPHDHLVATFHDAAKVGALLVLAAGGVFALTVPKSATSSGEA
jgi:EmrB/QacA subfamily drug resistance transporter